LRVSLPARACGNNSRADRHSNEDCAENEVVRHNGGPFGAALCCSESPGENDENNLRMYRF